MQPQCLKLVHSDQSLCETHAELNSQCCQVRILPSHPGSVPSSAGPGVREALLPCLSFLNTLTLGLCCLPVFLFSRFSNTQGFLKFPSGSFLLPLTC